MKVSEILNDENHESVKRLCGSSMGRRTAPRSVKGGTKPTLENVKRHLVNHLVLPPQLLKEPERAIILRAKAVQ